MSATAPGLVVPVSGMPGAGKSTLASPLAAELGLPMLAKDVIKEQLYDALPEPAGDPLAWSRTIGGAAMALLWRLADCAPLVLLEANFRPHSEYERGRLTGLGRPLIEVRCHCPPELAARRYAERAAGPGHHRGAHPMTELPASMQADFDRPLALGPVISIDTTRLVDVAAVARHVGAHTRATHGQ